MTNKILHHLYPSNPRFTSRAAQLGLFVAGALAIFPTQAISADDTRAPPPKYLSGDWEPKYAFSPAVATTGGKTIWVAGHHGALDDDGNSLAGNFDAQVRATFEAIRTTLARVDADLNDVVSMTVYITDAKKSARFTEIRKEYYPDGNYPASALVTVAGLALPEMMVEIQPIAVIDTP